MKMIFKDKHGERIYEGTPAELYAYMKMERSDRPCSIVESIANEMIQAMKDTDPNRSYK